ncbi:cytochrome C, partial [Enterococcus hirae]
HSVTPGDDGYIWVSGNGNATIIRLDPETEEMKVYPMPDPTARDPHTMGWDSDGMLWFSSQFGNMVGRLDPSAEDGDIELITMPVENS